MARTLRSPRRREGLTGATTPDATAARRGRWVLALAATAVLLAAADTYVVVLALPSIMNDVGIPISQLQQATRSSAASCWATWWFCHCSAVSPTSTVGGPF